MPTPGLIECRDQIAEAAEDGLPDAIRELDKRLARVAGYVGEEIDGCAMVPQADSGWWVWLKAIARGEYPLDKLPEHVRDLAAELYYD